MKLIGTIPENTRLTGNTDMPEQMNFEIYRGCDHAIDLFVRQGGRLYGDISEAKVYFTVRDIDTDQVVLQKRNENAGGSDDEIDMAAAEASGCQIRINHADTANRPANIFLKYDIVVDFGEEGEGLQPLIYGELFIIENQTRL
jgi:hypothetical protein